MHAPQLVKMANHIGQFFEAMPEPAHAQHELAEHLRHFWAPAMRQSLLAHLDTGDAPHLSASVAQALQAHRHRL